MDIVENKVLKHQNICCDLNKLYEKKNRDYGDSFSKSFEEFGLTMSAIRLDDKMRRLKSFIKNGNLEVKDESIIDTLMDLANYSILTILELQNKGINASSETHSTTECINHHWVYDSPVEMRETDIHCINCGVDKITFYKNVGR